jgi:hypothetical protein
MEPVAPAAFKHRLNLKREEGQDEIGGHRNQSKFPVPSFLDGQLSSAINAELPDVMGLILNIKGIGWPFFFHLQFKLLKL